MWRRRLREAQGETFVKVEDEEGSEDRTCESVLGIIVN